MPKLTNLFLAVLLISLTLNFCTKNNTPNFIDISGTYTDTITIGRYTPNIHDTVITKKVLKVDDSTFMISRFLGVYKYSDQTPIICDSAKLHIRSDNTIDIDFAGLNPSSCVAFFNSNPGNGYGKGYYDPSQQYLYLYHCTFGTTNNVVPLAPINIGNWYCYEGSSERMKKQ